MSWESESTKATAIIARIENEQETTLDDAVQNAKEALRIYEESLSTTSRLAAVLDQKQQEVFDEDEKLDKKLEELATVFIGTGLTQRAKPFGTFSPYSPARLAGMKLAREIQEVGKLVTNVTEAKPPQPVVPVLAELLGVASQVRVKLDGLTQPQDDFDKASKARSDSRLELKRSMRKLRLHAELAWPDDKDKLNRLFAPPEDVQDPVRRKRKPAGETQAVTETAD
jgi:predicted RNase H-like HicB family nuclease